MHCRVVELFLARRDQYPDVRHDLQLYWAALDKQGHRAGSHYLRMLRDVGLYTLPSDPPQEVNVMEFLLVFDDVVVDTVNCSLSAASLS